jgi:CBS domain containing-hemolysin-like protein
MAIILVLVVVCASALGISFLCSLMEAVLFSLNPLGLKLQQARGVEAAGRWLGLKQRIERPVAAILVFNTLANTGLAALAGAIYADAFGTHWLWLFSVVLTLAVLLAGEMMPKLIGVHHAERLAPRLIGPLGVMLRIAQPAVVLMEKWGRRLKGRDATARPDSAPIMDIITLVQAAKADRLLQNQEEVIIIHAATLSARRVGTAMVPRESVCCFDLQKSLLDNVLDAGKLHRSYPVLTSGQIVGYVRVRELFVQNLTEGATAGWTQLIRPVLHVDGRSSLTQLLALFLEKHEIAAIVDGSDSTWSGWVTLDDVTQVLMGKRI